LENQLLAAAPRAEPRLGEDLLEPFGMIRLPARRSEIRVAWLPQPEP
jgi:hypothetical protein